MLMRGVDPEFPLVEPLRGPSNTWEIRSGKRFLNDNYTSGDFLIDLLTVLNKLNGFSIGEY